MFLPFDFPLEYSAYEVSFLYTEFSPVFLPLFLWESGENDTFPRIYTRISVENPVDCVCCNWEVTVLKQRRLPDGNRLCFYLKLYHAAFPGYLATPSSSSSIRKS